MVFLLAESFDTLIQLDFTAAVQQTQINNKHTGRGVSSLSLLQLLHMNYGKLHSVWNVVNLGEAAVASLSSQLVPTADRVAQNPTCFWVLFEFTIPRPLRLISTLGRRVSRRQSESWQSKVAERCKYWWFKKKIVETGIHWVVVCFSWSLMSWS